MIFPFLNGDALVEEKSSEEDLPLLKEVAWDFKRNAPIIQNGDFKIVEGNEALKVWILKTLLINRYEFEIFSWDYGSELMDLIGKAYTPSLTKEEAKRYIKEALEINPYIINIDVVDVSFSDAILHGEVKIKTIYGEDDLLI